MLVLKKLSIKKMAIYVFIIVLMLAGTGLMLYQNQGLSNRQPLVIGNSAIGNFMTAEVPVPGDQAASDQPAVDPLKTDTNSSQSLGASKIKTSQSIDSTIFSSEKFKALEANIIIPQADSGLGKRDLFKPN